jgi:hypothetical protein
MGTSSGRSAMSGIEVGVDRDRRADGRAGGRPRKESTGAEGAGGVSSRRAID